MGGSLYTELVALALLVLLMAYVPYGLELGLIILAGLVLASPIAEQSFAKLLGLLRGGIS